MKVIERLVYDEPIACIEVHLGVFTYDDSSGESVTAEFYIKTCKEEVGNSAVTDKRVDDMNEQFTDQWMELEAQGCRSIHFKNDIPHPIL